MLFLKDKSVQASANGKSLRGEMYFALGVCETAFARQGCDLVVTALLDGSHNPGTLHFEGAAADIRMGNVPPDKRAALCEEVKKRLDRYGFDVVPELVAPAGKVWSGPHMHIEFDPKQGETFWHYQSAAAAVAETEGKHGN
jgi:hypothetical protein